MKKIPIINKEISPKSELFWDIEDAAILEKFCDYDLNGALADDQVSMCESQPGRRKYVAALADATRLRLAGKCHGSNRTSKWRLVGHVRGISS